MSGKTPGWARKAAEEVVRGDGGCAACVGPALCAASNSKEEVEACIIDNIATIITRHAEERERVLREAVQWAVETRDGCPLFVGEPYSCPPDEICSHDYEQCWIEYWKKVADTRQKEMP